MTGDTTIVLSARDVERLLPFEDCIDAIRATLCAHEAGRSRGPVATGFSLPAGSAHAKLAAIEQDGRTFLAVKANVNLPGNLEPRGRPTSQGALILFDGNDGRPLAVMDSIALTSVRTGATAAIAASHLAMDDAGTITIIGCGEQGEAQLRAMSLVRTLRFVWAIDIEKDKAERFATRFSDELGVPVEQTNDLDAALAASDICVTCTTSSQPVVLSSHLHPGLFVAAVGADNPGKHEIHADALAQSRVVVDSLSACAAGGDLHHAIAAGAMTEAGVYGELSAIVAGQLPGRTSRDQVFVFDSTGTALQDVAAAILVYRRALSNSVGFRAMLNDRNRP